MANIEFRLSTGDSSLTNVASIKSSIGGKMAESSTIKGQLASSDDKSYLIRDNAFGTNNLWDDISQEDNISQTPDYRCIYIFNNPTGPRPGPINGVKAYIGGSTNAIFELGKVENKNLAATPTNNELEAPAGISFDRYTKEKRLDIGTLNPGDSYAVWIKRTPQNISGAGEIREVFDLVITGAD